jgi:hypothetical protein
MAGSEDTRIAIGPADLLQVKKICGCETVAAFIARRTAKCSQAAELDQERVI